MVTDGVPDNRSATLRVAQEIAGDGMTLSSIGIAGGVDEDFLRQIAPNTIMIDSLTDMGRQLVGLLKEAETKRQSGLRRVP
jgi:hypothetical protein